MEEIMEEMAALKKSEESQLVINCLGTHGVIRVFDQESRDCVISRQGLIRVIEKDWIAAVKSIAWHIRRWECIIKHGWDPVDCPVEPEEEGYSKEDKREMLAIIENTLELFQEALGLSALELTTLLGLYNKVWETVHPCYIR